MSAELDQNPGCLTLKLHPGVDRAKLRACGVMLGFLFGGVVCSLSVMPPMKGEVPGLRPTRQSLSVVLLSQQVGCETAGAVRPGLGESTCKNGT